MEGINSSIFNYNAILITILIKNYKSEHKISMIFKNGHMSQISTNHLKLITTDNHKLKKNG